MKIYMVSNGTYSEFGYVGAFSCEDVANRFVEMHAAILDEPNVWAYEVDDLEVVVRDGLTRYAVSIGDDETTTVTDDSKNRTLPYYDGIANLETWRYTDVVYCWARDEQHAAKIAMEKWMQHKASLDAAEPKGAA